MNDIFDRNETIIHEPELTPLAFIDMNEYLKAANILYDFEVKENGDEIYYCTCPNEDKHNSEGVRHSMVFHSIGEKNPEFYCVHSQCKKITFNDLLKSVDIDYAQYIVKDEPQQQPQPIVMNTEGPEKLKKYIMFHGYEPDTKVHVLSSVDSYQFLRLTPSEMTTMNIINLFSDESILGEYFPLMVKNKYCGVNFPEVGKWIIRESKKSGVFKSTQIKPLGIHIEKKNGIVLNTGSFVYSCGKAYDYFSARALFDGFYIPSSQTIINIPTNEIAKNKLIELHTLINKLPFRSEQDKIIFIGVLICGLIPGGIDTRPSMWITGKSGSGKTTILETIFIPIWMASGAISIDAGSTAAGIEQDLKGKNVSIIFDEAEADTSRGNERITSILEGAKASTTSGSGVTLKGSAGGSSRSYKHKSCYCFSSVGSQIVHDTIKRRVFNVTIEQKPHHKTSWNKTRFKIENLITEEFTEKLFLYFFNRVGLFNENCLIVEEYLIETDIPSNVIAMWISIITAYLMFLGYEKLSADIIEKHMKKLIEEIVLDNEDSAETNNSMYLLDILFNYQLSLEDNKKIYIADLIRISLSKHVDTTISITQDRANAILAKCGIKTDEYNLYIHTKHDFLTTLYGKKNIVGYASRLATYPGAKKTENPIRYHTSRRNRALMIPIPEDILLSPEYEIPKTFEGNINSIFEREIKL